MAQAVPGDLQENTGNPPEPLYHMDLRPDKPFPVERLQIQLRGQPQDAAEAVETGQVGTSQCFDCTL
jgi:hypothetical protein